MITACIALHGRSAKRMEFLQTLKRIKDQLDKITKCRQAKIYQDVDNDKTFIFEEWVSENDLEEHLSSGLIEVSLGLISILKSRWS